eukprot:7382990-Prymnesium_polylepis.1
MNSSPTYLPIPGVQSAPGQVKLRANLHTKFRKSRGNRERAACVIDAASSARARAVLGEPLFSRAAGA